MLRRALCHPAGGFAARQRARLDCRLAERIPARQDHDNTHGIIGQKGFCGVAFGMGTLGLVSELKDLEECMDDGDSRVAKEAKLFDALE
ncbi:hypothetical protein Tco_1469914, partial [Tanacetum coccineum]